MSKQKYKLIDIVILSNTIAYLKSLHGKKWLGKFQINIERAFRAVKDEAKSFEETSEKTLKEFREAKKAIDEKFCKQGEKDPVQFSSQGIPLFMIVADVIYLPLYTAINKKAQEEYAQELEKLTELFKDEINELEELLQEEVEVSLTKIKEEFLPDDLDNEIIEKIFILIE